MSRLTPLMRQYLETKEQHPDAVLFFQLGDFYETFFEDAQLAARELDIVLTRREGTPMAGVPVKKAEVYVNRLLKRGHKVALCEQVEDPKAAKGMVRRQVTRVVTPGTVLEEDVLEQGSNNYLVCLWQEGSRWALAACDASTGEFRVTSLREAGELRSELVKLAPRELLLPATLTLELPPELGAVASTALPAADFRPGPLLEHFQLPAPEGLGLSPPEARAAGGLLSYLKRTQRTLDHLRRPRAYSAQRALRLDPFTIRNLELVRELRDGGSRATLLAVLNRALTGMGQRCLRSWVLSPLLDLERIEARLDAVQALVAQGLLRAELREVLGDIYDLERLVGRLGAGRATPRDLLALKQSLAKLPDLWLKLQELQEAAPTSAGGNLLQALESAQLRELAKLLEKSVRDDAPLTLKEGGVIREGFHPELGALKAQERQARERVLALEAEEREKTGIASLKVGYNAVFGYYLEVPKAQSKKVPPHYHRKQTLTHSERYIIPELKALEEKILTAQERSRELEYRLFLEVRGEVAAHIPALQGVAQALATLDALASLAEVAHHGDYVRPRFTARRRVLIRGGRHPVVETLMRGQAFVPNELTLEEDELLVILTGPNMSGKSTYLRQLALIALMAQLGSFVPAQEAELPVFDQVFTRVGASDMLAGGVSTFMAEMLETANILHHATERSLVLLDEMGRGTSTFDGVSIAWAVAEHLVRRVRAKVLFATHYHELTQLADRLPGVVNRHVRVKEAGGEVIFLHQVVPGAAAGSYGVHVAKLAGLPTEVTRQAEELLRRILAARPLEGIESGGKGPRVAQQLALFRQQDHPALEQLRELDPDRLTPLEALEWLSKLKALVDLD